MDNDRVPKSYILLWAAAVLLAAVAYVLPDTVPDTVPKNSAFWVWWAGHYHPLHKLVPALVLALTAAITVTLGHKKRRARRER
jgi:hypothetical protein